MDAWFHLNQRQSYKKIPTQKESGFFNLKMMDDYFKAERSL